MKTKEEMVAKGITLLQALSDFDCDNIFCGGCPFDTNVERGVPNPNPVCYSNQAAIQLEWLKDKNRRLQGSASEKQ